METTNNLPERELILDAPARDLLLSIAKWSKVLAAVGFLIFGGRLLITTNEALWSPDGTTDAIKILFRFALDTVFFFLALFPLLFSSRIDKALKTNHQPTLIKAFASLKSLFKLAGILGLIMTVSFTLLQLILGDGILK